MVKAGLVVRHTERKHKKEFYKIGPFFGDTTIEDLVHQKWINFGRKLNFGSKHFNLLSTSLTLYGPILIVVVWMIVA